MIIGPQLGFLRNGSGRKTFANAINFDGTNDWLGEPSGVTTTVTFSSLTSAETGATLSAWVSIDVTGTDKSVFDISSTNSRRFSLSIDTTGQPQVSTANAAGSTIFTAGGDNGTNAPLSLNVWAHLYVTFDSLQGVRICLNGTEIAASASSITSKPFQANRPIRIGARGSSLLSKMDGKIAELWFTNQFLSSGTYLSKFYNAGKAVNLGSDGSIPTGAAPKLYLPCSNISNLGINPGSEVDLSVNGAPTQAIGPQQ